MYTKIQSGYQRLVYTSDPRDPSSYEHSSSFLGFDEGVTEKLAQEILIKYLVRSNTINLDEARKYFQMKQYKQDLNPYHDVVQLVDVVTDRVAQNSGLARDAVWQAIVRGKLEGKNLHEIQPSIDEHTFEGFVETVKPLGYREVDSCLQELLIKS
jgi:hypothetical protein